ncbi:MAG TPA: valine--tRNA ligase [Nitrospiraceae bacterium]|jgi:valyl-tRNA synthetase|nr:valine--tRNA ligase [Nitrospiraceae bacterium]
MLRCLLNRAAARLMSERQLDKTYDPKQVEERWYQVWIDRGYFRASVTHPGRPYCIVIPPPNVTGSLHVGHALNNSLQDILIRWRRMQGRNVLWMPGTDHAGIATQNVVERQLLAEGTSREALGRERFLQRVWEWKAKAGDTIIQQLKRLGASCDWDRLRFTMDEGLSKAVREVFVRLYEDGLIYRGERLINWCPRCLTALSDIEVEHEDIRGKMYYIRYPLADDPGTALTVATTRPETMLGDTAVAVHPEDPRYRHLIGKAVRLPLTTRDIPIVGDTILVDLEFGTGAVKITPAHDFNDFEASERHGLPRISLLTARAQMDDIGLQEAQADPSLNLALKSVHQARTIVVEALRERGFLTKVEDHKMAIGKCYRCKTVVEPFLSPQWFVKIKPLAEPAIKVVEDGRIRLIPEAWVNNYLGWMRDIKDWCISRQIWWGHQIPAWYCTSCNREHIVRSGRAVGTTAEGGRLPEITKWNYTLAQGAQPVVAKSVPTRCPDCGGQEFVQDPDVLDTWFSSGLWPFSTLGWPDETPELKTYYPTSTLVTGLDILFFWVARMIMMGLKFTGDVPFRDVYIHALVRDAEGQKMSKSKGNVIDPLHMMERYGTDALRFTLASMASPGRDIKLSEERIEGYRNFANKLWNAARFILMHLDGPREDISAAARSFPDRWILSRLNFAIRSVTQELEHYRFDRAASRLYHFIWHEYCDWYLEMVKPFLQHNDSVDARRTRHTLVETFETVQRLLHPFMPFITEEIWQTLPHEGESLVIQPYPEERPDWDSKDTEHAFGILEQCVTTTRTARALLNYPPGKPVAFFAWGSYEREGQILETLQGLVAHLGRGVVQVLPFDQWPSSNVLRLAAEGLTVGMVVEGDVDLQKALARISRQRAEGAAEVQRLEAKLKNVEFTSNAPPDVVAEHQGRLKVLQRDQAVLLSSEEQLCAIMRRRAP